MKLIVAISYHKGAIVCHKYDKLDGAYFANFVNNNFDRMFRKADKNGSRVWVQDNCPVQNSACVRKVLSIKNAEQLKIPPRNGDIHCIENCFHVVKVELEKQALELNITLETYDEFTARVIRTIKNMPVQVVDKIIESMDQRMTLIINCKGQRTKYSLGTSKTSTNTMWRKNNGSIITHIMKTLCHATAFCRDIQRIS